MGWDGGRESTVTRITQKRRSTRGTTGAVGHALRAADRLAGWFGSGQVAKIPGTQAGCRFARRASVEAVERLALQAAGLGWVAWLASSGSGYGRFVLPMIIAGVGVSMAVPAVPAAALGAVAPQDMGRASGVNNTLQRFGGAFGVAVAAAVFSAHGQLGSPAGMTAGFRPALVVSALLSLLGAGAAVLAAGGRVRRRPRSRLPSRRSWPTPTSSLARQAAWNTPSCLGPTHRRPSPASAGATSWASSGRRC